MKMILVVLSLSTLLWLLPQPALACTANDVEKVASVAQENLEQPPPKQPEPASSEQIAAISNPVDVTILKKRLRKTRAIGFFTKLALRSDLLDLMRDIKRYRKKSTLDDKLDGLRANFDGLLLKIIALLDRDPDLSRDLYMGRETIWQSLLEEKA